MSSIKIGWRRSLCCLRPNTAWWSYDIETLATLPGLCEGNSPVTCRFFSQRIGNANLWCFRCCQRDQTVEQTVKLSVVWDAMMNTCLFYNCAISEYRNVNVVHLSMIFDISKMFLTWFCVPVRYDLSNASDEIVFVYILPSNALWKRLVFHTLTCTISSIVIIHEGNSTGAVGTMMEWTAWRFSSRQAIGWRAYLKGISNILHPNMPPSLASY